MATPVLTLALIGCGDVAYFHIKAAIALSGRVQIVAAIDPCIERAQLVATYLEKLQPAVSHVSVFASLAEALAAREKRACDFMAVDILVPHHLHKPITFEALDAGLHVLLEKPISTSLQEAREILEKGKESKVVFMIAENAQYWPEIVKAHELIQQGVIGNIVTARAVYNERYRGYAGGDSKEDTPSSTGDSRYEEATFPKIDRKERAEDRWRGVRAQAGGGMVMDGGSHWIRPLRMWMGEIDKIVGVTGRVLPEMEGETLAKAIFKFKSGQMATFECTMSYTPFAPDPWWRITGTTGEITIDELGIWLHTEDPRYTSQQPPHHHHPSEDHRGILMLDPPKGYPESFTPEMEDFYMAVCHGKSLAAPPEMAFGELAAAFAIYESVERQAWVAPQSI
eukprot:TRINITY_DN14311_c0_g1_i6.p1 TRINITY_DN14311_c0_g1~~TRINITY_DN14311_c0_g1_i6.p1  ORF type:complete len:409 (+),score=72.80 TRINITY_DN14311_c0_g1_i6:42-1229(+)